MDGALDRSRGRGFRELVCTPMAREATADEAKRRFTGESRILMLIRFPTEAKLAEFELRVRG